MGRVLASALVAVLLLGCTPSDTLTRRERIVEENVLGQRFQDWVTAINNRDIGDLHSMYFHDDDLRVVGARGERANGWTEREMMITNFYGSIDYVNFVPQAPDIQVLTGTYAMVSFRHSTTTDFRMSGRHAAAGSGFMVWEKDDADELWKIRGEMLSIHAPSAQ